MSNVICTIVAKNYLSLALALGNSIKKNDSDVNFCILLVDGLVSDSNINEQLFEIHTLNDLSLSEKDIKELSFKYNVTEFCTAVKPYYIDFLFKEGASKVIYFDPDIFVFSSIKCIFDELNTNSVVLTPHFLTPEIEYSGTITESLLLHVGTYNFGFIAINNNQIGKQIIRWWCNRLFNKSYQDKIEAYHTDQKWGDLLPAFWRNNILISDDLGRNMSFWNLHERELQIIDGKYYVNNRISNDSKHLLKFYHFAGFLVKNPQKLIHKNNSQYTFLNFPEIEGLYADYGKELERNGYYKYIEEYYRFNYYSDDKTPIYSFHRRLFRRLISDGMFFQDPFAMSKDSFYNILLDNNLIPKSNSNNLDKLNETNFKDFNQKVNFLNKMMIILNKIIGPQRYFLLLKFSQRYFRVENQVFLLKIKGYEYVFINENRKELEK